MCVSDPPGAQEGSGFCQQVGVVVSKQARVVEEVVVGKETVQHEETIRDTVRRTDVEIEEVEGDATTRKANS